MQSMHCDLCNAIYELQPVLVAMLCIYAMPSMQSGTLELTRNAQQQPSFRRVQLLLQTEDPHNMRWAMT